MQRHRSYLSEMQCHQDYHPRKLLLILIFRYPITFIRTDIKQLLINNIRLINLRMQNDHQDQQGPLIDQFVGIGIDQSSKNLSIQQQYQWITSIRLLNFQQKETVLERCLQKNIGHKYVQLEDNLYLMLYFCEEEHLPISRITCKSNPSPHSTLNLLKYPQSHSQFYDEYICYETTQSHASPRIIQDIEIVETYHDGESDLLCFYASQSYEIVRLPNRNKQDWEENNSGEELMEKKSFLVLKTLDLNDQNGDGSQFYQAKIVYTHLAKGNNCKNKNKAHQHNLSRFCFPLGIKVNKTSADNTNFNIFNFILTDQNNNRIYVNCLEFVEELSQKESQNLVRKIEKVINENQPKSVFQAGQAFCIISKHCFTDFFSFLLEQIFRRYQSLKNEYNFATKIKKNDSPKILFKEVATEFIKKYEQKLEIPKEIEYMKQEYLQKLKIQINWFGTKIVFPKLDPVNLSFSKKGVYCLFKMLTINNIMQIFEGLLLQRKIIFVSDSQIVLGYIIESFLSFMYPLKWQHPIISVITPEIIDYLESPMPIIAGVQTLMLSEQFITKEKDAMIVFLDCNEMINPKKETMINHLKQTRKQMKFYEIYSQEHVSQYLELRDKFYTFKIHQIQEKQKFSPEHIKHLFFELMLTLLKGYEKYFADKEYETIQNQKKNGGHYFHYKTQFKEDEFIKSHPKNNHKFLKKLCQCSHFINFVHQKYQSPFNPEVMLVDKALKSLNKFNSHKDKKRMSYEPSKNHEDLLKFEKKTSLQQKKVHSTSLKGEKDLKIQKKESSEKDKSTNYTRNQSSEKPSVIQQNLKETEQEPEPPETKAKNICEAITRAMKNASKYRVILWTKAKVTRLKKYLTEKQKKQNQEKEVSKQKGQNIPQQFCKQH